MRPPARRLRLRLSMRMRTCLVAGAALLLALETSGVAPAVARAERGLWRGLAEAPVLAAASEGAQQAAQPAQPPPPADQTAQPPVFRAGINFVRVDVIVSDKTGNAGRRSPGGGLRRQRGRQAAEDRNLQAHQARRRHGRVDQGAAEGNPQRLRRRIGSGARRCAAVRDFPRRLPRAARHEHGGARPAGALHRHAARPVRHGRRDVPARVDRVRCA